MHDVVSKEKKKPISDRRCGIKVMFEHLGLENDPSLPGETARGANAKVWNPRFGHGYTEKWAWQLHVREEYKENWHDLPEMFRLAVYLEARREANRHDPALTVPGKEAAGKEAAGKEAAGEEAGVIAAG